MKRRSNPVEASSDRVQAMMALPERSCASGARGPDGAGHAPASPGRRRWIRGTLRLGLALRRRVGLGAGRVREGFERLGAPSDRSQRIVDFMGNSSGQEPNAGKLLVANHLFGSLSDLLLEILLNR